MGVWVILVGVRFWFGFESGVRVVVGVYCVCIRFLVRMLLRGKFKVMDGG